MASYDISGATVTITSKPEIFELTLNDGSKSTLKAANAEEAKDWVDALTELSNA